MIGKNLHQDVARHATPGGNVARSRRVIGGNEQRLPWYKLAHSKQKLHYELAASLLTQVKFVIGVRSHHQSGLSQKIAVALFAFLLSEQLMPRHATPCRQVLTHPWIGRAHFEHCPGLQTLDSL